MIYKVRVCLSEDYDDIEADTAEEAFIIASELAMSGGTWQYTVEQID